MTKEIWKVSDSGIYLEKYPNGVILNYPPDDAAIMISEDEISVMIETLQRIRVHFETQELATAEAKRLECWGKQRTPTESERNFAMIEKG